MRLWQRSGETYGHVLMKALGYAMFVREYPDLEIERRVGMRYKPDLVAEAAEHRRGLYRFKLWGECGLVTMRKVAWLLKHGQIERLALFKTGRAVAPLVDELRSAVDARYRVGGRVELINFVADIDERTADRRIAEVPPGWYTRVAI